MLAHDVFPAQYPPCDSLKNFPEPKTVASLSWATSPAGSYPLLWGSAEIKTVLTRNESRFVQIKKCKHFWGLRLRLIAHGGITHDRQLQLMAIGVMNEDLWNPSRINLENERDPFLG